MEAMSADDLSASILELYTEDCQRLLSRVRFERRAAVFWDRVTPDAAVVLLLLLAPEERVANLAIAREEPRGAILIALPARAKRE